MSVLRWSEGFITDVLPLLLLLLLALALPAQTSAHHKGALWATVNICDTEKYPNTLGVRASMPGNGTKQTMWMRFRGMYYDRATTVWRDIGGDSRSPWIKVGNAKYKSRQAGRRFKLDPPLPTTTFVVRAEVDFQWRGKRGKVKRRATQKTLSGHKTGRHADPRGYSNGVCEIAFP
jgi:hypothetical protein